MSVFSAPQSNHEAIGQALREARLAQGWSGAEVADRIGASQALVEQLECNAGEGLAPIYRDAFLKRYLALVGMDENLGPPSAPPDIQPVMASVNTAPRRHWFNQSLSWLRYMLVSMVVVPPLLWFGINHSATWLTQGIEGPAELAKPLIEEKTTKRRSRMIQASQLPRRPRSQRPAADQSTQPNGLGIDGASALASSSATNASLVAPTNQQLTLRLNEDTWVEVEDATGKRLEHNLLRKNATQRYEGEAPFDVLLGKGGAVEMTLNGQSIDYLSRNEQPNDAVGLTKLRVLANGQVERKP